MLIKLNENQLIAVHLIVSSFKVSNVYKTVKEQADLNRREQFTQLKSNQDKVFVKFD